MLETKNHCKFLLRCHMIFVVKYRKSILIGQLEREMAKILLSCQTEEFCIETMKADRDHIHMIVRYVPQISLTTIVRRLKQLSTFRIWKLCPKYLARYFWKEHTFWSDGYFVSSIGNASTETVRKYIESQG